MQLSKQSVEAVETLIEYVWEKEFADYVRSREEGLPANDPSHVFVSVCIANNELSGGVLSAEDHACMDWLSRDMEVPA